MPACAGHTSLTKASNLYNFQRPFASLLLPSLSRWGKGTLIQRQLRTRERVGKGGSCQPLLHCPINHRVQSRCIWGSQAPSAIRSPRDNGIIFGGRGRLGQGLRRRCLLPSIRPLAPNKRRWRPGAGGKAAAGGARVAEPDRPNSISWAAAASAQLWAPGAGLRAAALCARSPCIWIQSLPLGTPPLLAPAALFSTPLGEKKTLVSPEKLGNCVAAGEPYQCEGREQEGMW